MKFELQRRERRLRKEAFTLLEVMIALMLFFMAAFAILQLTSQNMRAARLIQQSGGVSAAVLAAELWMTNSLVEGMESGDFGDLYPGYTWMREVSLATTNGLYRVDLAVIRPNNSGIESQMSILLYKPGGALAGAPGGRNTRRSMQ